MNVVATAALLAQPQTDPTNTGVLWTIIGVLGVVVAFLVWRNFAKMRAAPAAEPAAPVPVKPTCEPLRLPRAAPARGPVARLPAGRRAGYTDAQIGAAVRDIHRNCRKAIQEHLVLEPILPDRRGRR